MQSQVKFNRFPEKVPGEGSRKPWCKAKSGSTGFWRRFRRRSGGFGVECRVRSSSTGFRRRFR